MSINGSDAFSATYGSLPTYELFEDGGSPDAVPDMRDALGDSISTGAGLTNGGEPAILYRWDGMSDLVTDLDYVLWGNRTYAVDKTGVSIDGPGRGHRHHALSGRHGHRFSDPGLPVRPVLAPPGSART